MSSERNDQLMRLLDQLSSIGNDQNVSSADTASSQENTPVPSTERSAPPQPPSTYQRAAKPDLAVPSRVKLDSSIFSVDPSTITTYSGAVKYVTLVLVREDMQFISQVKVLIDEQRLKEQQWHAGAEAISKKQLLRKEGRGELASVLKILGVSNSGSNGDDSSSTEKDAAKDNQRELTLYYRNVYKQLQDFTKLASAQLAELKVPLFCINPGLRSPKLLKEQERLLDFLQTLCEDEKEE